MALTKISTDTIDLSADTNALKMPKGTTAERQIEYLVVAGGGGGAGNSSGGGGGGAGGLLSGTTDMIATTNLTITVGTGGAGTIGEGSTDVGGNGTDSVFDNITATGGGGAGNTGAGNSANGGSGGGASGGTAVTPGNGIPPQGNNGGTGSDPSDIGGGGGGAGGVGQPGGSLGSIPSSGTFTGTDGQGGAALSNSITGTAVLYAGGGGGGVCDFVYNVGTPATTGLGGAGVAGTGGNGGQSDGSTTAAVNGGNGTANTGGGGGGGSRSASGSCNGGDGGSGIVILRYASKYTLVASAGLTTGVLNGTVGDDKYTTFTAGTGTISGLNLDIAIGTMRENTTTGNMEIYTGAKGWRALQQTGQDAGVVASNGFGTALYTGNGGADNINLNFQPDLIWIKGRDTNGKFNAVYDSVRGATNMISTNSTDYGSWNPYGSVTPTASGFEIGSASAGDVNASGEEYVSWSWKAGGNSNTFNIDGVGYATAAAAGMNAGSISPNACSVSTEYGFSITKYDSGICGTSNPPCFNWSHGLNQEPDFVTNKMLNYSYGWDSIFKPAGYSGGSNTGGWQYLQLNTTAAMASSPHYSADSTLIYETMSSGASYPLVTYAWHSVPGYSLIGSYTGTGSATDSPKIYTGFEPAWLMTKPVSTTGWWYIFDNKRSTNNPRDIILGANSSDSEYTSSNYDVNFYNDGFQYRNSTICCNDAGVEYLFMCFAS
jgi:hypothetical protein